MGLGETRRKTKVDRHMYQGMNRPEVSGSLRRQMQKIVYGVICGVPKIFVAKELVAIGIGLFQKYRKSGLIIEAEIGEIAGPFIPETTTTIKHGPPISPY